MSNKDKYPPITKKYEDDDDDDLSDYKYEQENRTEKRGPIQELLGNPFATAGEQERIMED